jgi:predicted ATPase
VKKPRKRSRASMEVPQTRQFADLHAVLASLAAGVSTTEELAARTHLARRQVNYALVTAREFGLLAKDGAAHRVLPAGRQLVAAKTDHALKTVLGRALRASAVVKAVAPDLLADDEPSQGDIANRIIAVAQLSPETAHHRAGAFLAWRRQLKEAQGSLFFSPSSSSGAPVPDSSRLVSPKPAPAASSRETQVHDFDKEVGRIRRKLASNEFQLLIRNLYIDGLRGFHACSIEFQFPIIAVVGENGAGKTTLLKALACAYEQAQPRAKSFMPGHFFVSTPWEKVEGVNLKYALKHGTEEKQVHIRKPTERWRGVDKRPKRNVFLYDISRTMPIDALVGYAQIARSSLKLASEDVEADWREKLSFVMGRSYKAARFALKERKRVGVLSQAFGTYSKFHQGAGEAAALDLVGYLQAIPSNSLLLIDEVEASLHPKAQRRLIQTLLWLCRTKNLQVVLSTHSRYVLDELPPEARVLLIKGGGDTKVIYGASADFCLTTIDDKRHPQLVVFVEDLEAQVLVRELLAFADTKDEALLQKTEILPVGPANVVVTLHKLGQAKALRFACMGVLDGDSRDDAAAGCAVLPGDAAPERQVFGDLKAAGWPGVSERLGVPPGELHSKLEEAMLLPDHHRWCEHVGNGIRVSSTLVWATLAALWVRHCVSVADGEEFVQHVRDYLA